jgi:SAM-dependent methyltransferase
MMLPCAGVGEMHSDVMPLDLEFGWHAERVAEAGVALGLCDSVPIACRGSGHPKLLGHLAERIGARPGLRVLDGGSGLGGPMAWLAREHGCEVVGVDSSELFVSMAREADERSRYEVRDMRELDFDGEFDAVVNLFTAFGYFDEEEENERVVAGVARALRPGGRFLIDVLNLLGLPARYRERMWDEREGGATMLARHRYDMLRGRNEATWTFLHPDGTRSELRHRVRLYAPHELARMLERAGLDVVGSWGDFDASELSMTSRRLILRADRP